MILPKGKKSKTYFKMLAKYIKQNLRHTLKKSDDRILSESCMGSFLHGGKCNEFGSSQFHKAGALM